MGCGKKERLRRILLHSLLMPYKLEFGYFYKYQYECIPHKYVFEFFGICFIAL